MIQNCFNACAVLQISMMISFRQLYKVPRTKCAFICWPFTRHPHSYLFKNPPVCKCWYGKKTIAHAIFHVQKLHVSKKKQYSFLRDQTMVLPYDVWYIILFRAQFKMCFKTFSQLIHIYESHSLCYLVSLMRSHS